MNARLILGTLLLAASTTLLAQAPQQAKPKEGMREGQREGHGMRPCSQEPDPAKCEVRRKELREQFRTARETCKGKERADRGPCMAQQMCAKAPDPAKCMSHAKERMQQRRETREKGSGKP
jgi:hypothetical protein